MSVIGKGGFGEVFEVQKDKEKYAMKIIKYIDCRLLEQNMSEIMINSAMDH